MSIKFALACDIVPVVTVLRWNRRGVVMGTFANWFSLVVAGVLITQLDPTRLRGFTATLDVIWFFFGWVYGLSYSLLIYAVKCLVLLLWQRWRAQSTREDRLGTEDADS